jgi:methylmalonyl-CoA mutase cobalamin-binding domain/chain
MSDDDLDLRSLDDDELVQQMHDDLYDGLKEEIEEGVNILLERGWTPYKILTEGLVEGMRIVGVDFRDGILFVPEVLLAANAMKAGMAILRRCWPKPARPRVGKMVIGTVKGDIHDIGKNLVSMMMEGAGFEVIDIGINNPVENYLAALEEHQPDILGMSALLTTTMPYMKVVIDTLKEKGMRDDYVVLVGGAPLNEEFARRRRRRLLPRCRRGRRDRQGIHESQAQPGPDPADWLLMPAATAFQNPPGQSRRGGFSLYVTASSRCPFRFVTDCTSASLRFCHVGFIETDGTHSPPD